MKRNLISWLEQSSEKEVYPVLEALLQAMEYERVQIAHGPDEAGKDLVFLERDRVGRSLWRAVQVKAGKVTGQLASGTGARGLLHQCEAALDTPFRLVSGERVQMSEVWLVFTSRLSGSAKRSLEGKLRNLDRIQVFDASDLADWLRKYHPRLIDFQSPISAYRLALADFCDSLEEYVARRVRERFNLSDVFVPPMAEISLVSLEAAERLNFLAETPSALFLRRNMDDIMRLRRRKLLPALLHFNASSALTELEQLVSAVATVPWYDPPPFEARTVLDSIRQSLKLERLDEISGLALNYRYQPEIGEETLRELHQQLIALLGSENQDNKLAEIFGLSKDEWKKARPELASQIDILRRHDRRKSELRQEEKAYKIKKAEIPSLSEPLTLGTARDLYASAQKAYERFWRRLHKAYTSSVGLDEPLARLARLAARALAEKTALHKKIKRKVSSDLEAIEGYLGEFDDRARHRVKELWGSLRASKFSRDLEIRELEPSNIEALVELEELSRLLKKHYKFDDGALVAVRLRAEEACLKLPRLAVIGELGSGKTTLLKQVTKRLSENEEEGVALPVFCRLATLGVVEVDDFTTAVLGASEADPVIQNEKSQKQRTLAWVLDGFDEVSSTTTRRTLLEWLSTEGRDQPLLLSSRPYALPDFLPRTITLRLQRFDREQIWTYLERFPWAEENNTDKLKVVLESSSELADMAGNPLLLTLIVVLADTLGPERLPRRREELYDVVVRLLMGEWDAAKRVGRVMDAGEVEVRYKVLKKAAYDLYRLRKRSFTREDFIDSILSARSSEPFTVDFAIRLFSGFERDCVLVPLATNQYSFFHFSIQEYLAACELSDSMTLERPYEAVRQFFENDAWWEEVLVFYAAIKRETTAFFEHLHEISIPPNSPFGRLSDDYLRLISRMIEVADFTDLKLIQPQKRTAEAFARLRINDEEERWLRLSRLQKQVFHGTDWERSLK